MKYIRDRTGRFPQRPHYDPEELDYECEAIITKFLREKYGHIKFPISTEDLTVFIEQHAGSLDVYADLSSYGAGVEGVTEFHIGKKPNVKISQTLSEDSHRENRLRTTLTHEFGHVHFHTCLLYTSPSPRDRTRSRMPSSA